MTAKIRKKNCNLQKFDTVNPSELETAAIPSEQKNENTRAIIRIEIC